MLVFLMFALGFFVGAVVALAGAYYIVVTALGVALQVIKEGEEGVSLE